MQISATDRVLGRIRKMLALANDAGASEGERENAMRMAYATMAKYNLSIEEFADGGTKDEKREEQIAQMSIYPWARNIAHTIAELYFCSYYFARKWRGKTANHYFVGKHSNAVTAKEMSEYVVSNVFRELRARFGSETSPEARSFAVGVAHALRVRAAKMRFEAEKQSTETVVSAAPGTALVLSSVYKNEEEANRQWIDENVGKLKNAADRQKGVYHDSYLDGKRHGQNINLAPQLKGGDKPRLPGKK
jgi:hypothetical protein